MYTVLGEKSKNGSRFSGALQIGMRNPSSHTCHTSLNHIIRRVKC